MITNSGDSIKTCTYIFIYFSSNIVSLPDSKKLYSFSKNVTKNYTFFDPHELNVQYANYYTSLKMSHFKVSQENFTYTLPDWFSKMVNFHFDQ